MFFKYCNQSERKKKKNCLVLTKKIRKLMGNKSIKKGPEDDAIKDEKSVDEFNETINSHCFRFDQKYSSNILEYTDDQMTLCLPPNKQFPSTSGALTAVCSPAVKPPFHCIFEIEEVKLYQLFGIVLYQTVNFSFGKKNTPKLQNLFNRSWITESL